MLNHFASALHKHILYKNNLNAVCLCFLTLCIPVIQLFISAFGRPFRVCCIWMNGVCRVHTKKNSVILVQNASTLLIDTKIGAEGAKVSFKR